MDFVIITKSRDRGPSLASLPLPESEYAGLTPGIVVIMIYLYLWKCIAELLARSHTRVGNTEDKTVIKPRATRTKARRLCKDEVLQLCAPCYGPAVLRDLDCCSTLAIPIRHWYVCSVFLFWESLLPQAETGRRLHLFLFEHTLYTVRTSRGRNRCIPAILSTSIETTRVILSDLVRHSAFYWRRTSASATKFAG